MHLLCLVNNKTNIDEGLREFLCVNEEDFVKHLERELTDYESLDNLIKGSLQFYHMFIDV